MPINFVLSHALKLQGIIHYRPGYASITRLIGRSGSDAAPIGTVSINESGRHPWADESTS